ncbi:MAG: hypothetical protein PHC31_10330, partial [Clostridia bacterium]|nr:hypothetical protein [Clostridia bacterium]
DLHPLEKYTCLEHCLTKIICNFEILLLLAAGALCSCRAHTRGIANKGFSGMRRFVARFNFRVT